MATAKRLSKKSSSTLKKPQRQPQASLDDFESVAKRLGCDPNLKAFDAKLKKIAKAKASTLIRPKVHR